MADTPAPRILIVDDESAQMKALCNTLKDHGYDTVGFSSAKAALESLRKSEYDLLLTDLMMPEMNGINLLQGALEKDPDLVGIIMTGEGTIATAVEAMKSGALDYILKPFKLSVVLPVLSRAMSIRRLRLENIALGQSVRERTVQLEEANKELEAFSYSVSHDLRTPLRHINGFIDFLKDSDSHFTDEERNYLGLIASSAKQMGQMIDDLLEFSRMSRTEMWQTEVELKALVEEIIQQLKPETKDRNIEWNIADLPNVQADPFLLRHVLSNLILNAIKYSKPRNPAVIEIGASANDTEATIFVKDNGVGFDMKYADKLFGVFQRLHRKEEFEGVGVGLANVRRIIARHGGKTWAEGKVGEGATFYFSLPCAKGTIPPVQ
ncbi:MAG TPA: response regulator [Verrucomicrobiae bacterium]